MRLMKLMMIVLASVYAAACDAPSPKKTTVRAPSIATDTGIPLGQLPLNVEPLHYRLDLTINPDQLRYEGVAEIDIELKAPKREFFIHGKELQVSGITAQLQNKSVVKGTYTQVDESGVAKLSFEQQIPAGKILVTLPFRAAFEVSPDALTSMTENGVKYVWTQFEAISARRAFPCFDEPRFKTPFDISITAIERDVAISNTLPINQETISEGLVRTTFATTAPLPTYLVAIAVGPYDIMQGPNLPPSKLRALPLPVRAITVAGKGSRAAFALKNTPPIIAFLEDYFAAPFPYPKLDLIAPPGFTAGGMENAGAITYTERGILLDEKSSVQQRRYFTLLHAHEIAHQWFGDLVTPEWWNDIWLNEAFASWMGNKTALAAWPTGEFDRETIRDALNVMDADALRSARSIRQPIQSNGDIFNAFDGLTYNKGAGVLQMFEAYVGHDAFREGVRRHMRLFAHGSADVHDFMSSLAQGSKKPEIIPAFESFLNQPGVPLVHLETSCTQKDLNVSISQSPYGSQSPKDKRTWLVPVCMREMSRGSILPCAMLNQRTAKFTIKRMCGTSIMPNAQGTGYYRFTMPPSEWAKLAATFAKLSPAEQLAALHSMRVAFQANQTDAQTYLSALRVASTFGTWDVIELAHTFLTEIQGTLLPPSERNLFEQTLRNWFAKIPVKTSLVARVGEKPSATLSRAAYAELMTKLARDPSLISALAVRGANSLKAMAAGKADNATPPEILPTALWAAVHTGGTLAVRDAFVAINATSSAEDRNIVIKALAAARENQAIVETQEFVISGALRLRELSTYLREAFADTELRARTWDWFRRDYDKIVANTSAGGLSRFVSLPSTLCSDTAHSEVEEFFKPKIGKIVGAPRKLANALETIDNCVLWRSKKGTEIAKALKPDERQAPR